MNYLIFIMTILACLVFAYITVDEKVAKKVRILNITKSDEIFASKKLSKSKKIIIILILIILSGCAEFFLLRNTTSVMDQVKMSIALACLVGTAGNDYREQRIPNIFSMIMATTGIVCLIAGVLVQRDGAMAYVVSSLYATIGVAVCLIFAAILTKQGIGMGDIKALCALALIGGVYTICGTLFFGMCACVCCTVFLLLTKRKKMNESVPFGPFIYIGYIITIILGVY